MIFDWIKNRWFDLRNGQAYYVAFIMQSISFMIILYSLTPFRNYGYGYALILLLGIGVISTFIGYFFHRKKQISIDQNSMFKQSPLAAKVQRIILECVMGVADDVELDWALQLLRNIESGKA